MGTFKVTDLMIKVLPQAQACVGASAVGCNPSGCFLGDSAVDPCGGGPTVCNPSCTQGPSCQCSNCSAGCSCTCSGGCSGVSCTACSNHQCTCSGGCSSPTCGCSLCSGDITCGGHSGVCNHPSHLPLAPEDRLAGLSALKEQLKQQLAAVEKLHNATEESLRPQTVAEVDELQKKLEAALGELKARRAELEQKAKKPPSA